MKKSLTELRDTILGRQKGNIKSAILDATEGITPEESAKILEDINKIPSKVITFFKENSLSYLIDEIEITQNIIENKLSYTTRKFLKLVAMYLM